MLGLKDSSVNVQTSHHNKQFDTLCLADFTHSWVKKNMLVCLVKARQHLYFQALRYNM